MRVVIWCGMLRWWTPLHHLMSRPRQRWQARRPRLPRREQKRQVQRFFKHARLRSSIAMDPLGPINVTDHNFLRDLGRKLTTSTGDKRETCFLLQRLSVTIQRVNSVAFRGTLPEPDLRESQL